MFMYEESVELFENCLLGLKVREKTNEVDLKVSDIILANFKDNVLFDTMNHPRGLVFKELSNKIIGILGGNRDCYNFDDFKIFLGSVSIPPYYSTKFNLGLNYELEDFSTVDGELISIDEVVDRFYYDYMNSSLSLETLLEKNKSKNVIILDRVVNRCFFDG